MKLVKVSNLKDGMILARDVYSIDGLSQILLLRRGLAITEENIHQFFERGITEVFIRDGKNDDIAVQPILDRKTRDKAIKAIKDVFSKNSINSITIGEREMHKLEVVSEEIVEQVLRSPNLQVSINELKSYDDYTYHHCLSVSVLSIAIAAGLQLEYDKVKKIGLAGLLHDVGKIMVGIELINKPGKLTPEEFDEVKKHTLYGGEYLKSHNLVDFDVYNGVLMHHEKYDGTGYPFGLSGENIPLFGRIIAVADVYDALTSNRSYRPAKESWEAYEFLLGGCDTHFDTEMVHAFAKKIAPYPIGSLVKLSNGDVGVVTDVNSDFPLRPEVSSVIEGKVYRLWEDSEKNNITVLGDLRKYQKGVL